MSTIPTIETDILYLEELYEKYKGAGKSMPPEIKLLILMKFIWVMAIMELKQHQTDISINNSKSCL